MSDSPIKPSEPSTDSPISLERLGDAFAGMMRSEEPGTRETGTGSDSSTESTDGQASPIEDRAETEEMGNVTPKSILEALLFVGHPSNEPLSTQQVTALIHGIEPEEVETLVAELNEEYETGGHPYEIVSAGAGFRLVLREAYQRVRDNFYGRLRQARLSQAAIEVLALVAYNQPMTCEEASKLRGHPSGPILSQLVRRHLLRVERPDKKPRRRVYFTTDRFLNLFGLSGLDELPKSPDSD